MRIDHLTSGYQSLRKGRSSQAGQTYLVTFVTHKREQLFSDWELAKVASASLASQASWLDATLLCWTLMPDHWHGLLQLGTQAGLTTVVGAAKGRSSRVLNRARGTIGSIWMAGFHDHALRGEESLMGVARYVLANPLRAGLTSSLCQYPFWDAAWL